MILREEFIRIVGAKIVRTFKFIQEFELDPRFIVEYIYKFVTTASKLILMPS
jgi:hypothetical protein